MRIELFFVVVEDEEHFGLAGNHVVEVAIDTCTGELTSNQRNVVLRCHGFEPSDDVVAHDLRCIEDATPEFGLVTPAKCK